MNGSRQVLYEAAEPLQRTSCETALAMGLWHGGIGVTLSGGLVIVGPLHIGIGMVVLALFVMFIAAILIHWMRIA
jgi:hypothetical protein